MSTTSIVTIFVRHSAGCKYAGDEFTKRYNCNKHLRWTNEGKQHRRAAGTRSWSEAEARKREVDDEIAGRAPVTTPKAKSKPDEVKDLATCIAVFIQDKQVQGVTQDVIGKNTRLLARLKSYCDGQGVYTVEGITRDLLTGFCATWPSLYPSSITRSKLRERLRSFLRYCYEAQWLDRIPAVTKFKIDEPETQPLTLEEYERLLAAVRGAITKGDVRRKTGSNNGRRSPDEEEAQIARMVTFLETMRWTGLAIRDALPLRRGGLTYDSQKTLYRVTTKRAKTGIPVSVPIPARVATALLALPGNGSYFFWSGNGKPQSATSNWGQRYIAPVFKAAGIISDGNMVSHRLRDTFAVDLLEKGFPIEELSRLLGHHSIRTTESAYAKWSKGRQDRADALVTATWTQETTPRKRGDALTLPSSPHLLPVDESLGRDAGCVDSAYAACVLSRGCQGRSPLPTFAN